VIESAQGISADNHGIETTLRKVSWRILPLIGLAYGVAYMDRVNISYASLEMNRDLQFSATVYGFGAGLFFLSYAACEVPSNLALYRFGARRWLARIMITWGILAILMLFVRTPIQFYALRFLLGMAEAGFFPGVVFYLTQWFPPRMRARAVSRFYVSIPLSSVVMGAVAGALLDLHGRLSLAGWQWLFLIEGLPAILLGIVFLVYLPDNPQRAKWLTDAERVSILESVSAPERPASHGVGTALRDPRVWLLGGFMFCILGSFYALLFSAPVILQKLTGFTISRTGFLIAGVNLLGAFAMVSNAELSDRRGSPFNHMLPGCFLALSGFLILGLTSNPVLALAAFVSINCGLFSLQGPLWAVGTSYFSGRSAAAAIAVMNTIGIVGGFVGPYWIGITRDMTGSYQRGLLTLCFPMLLGAGVLLYLRQARVLVLTAAEASLP
jgi:ACS family tartrate transporter-like MFS transporter